MFRPGLPLQFSLGGAMRADGVSYFKFEGTSADFFRCEPYRASMSTDACAKRWNAAQASAGRQPDPYERCQACSIGAAHAGKAQVHYSKHFGQSFCPRCGQHANRMIGGTRCVSCYNREREFVEGANAKGTMPKLMLYPHRVAAIVDGARRQVTTQLALDVWELVFNTIRTTRGRLNFGTALVGQPAGLRQLRLAV